MAITLGTFTKLDDGIFSGTLKTLNVSAALTVVPVDKVSDNAPDYRVYAGQRYEIGAGWSQVAKSSLAHEETAYARASTYDDTPQDPVSTARIICLGGRDQSHWCQDGGSAGL